MLKAVQIPAAERRLHAYPHELSGGMRQRVMIAMALACRPKLLIADEPTTALDVTVQAQVFDLLKALQDEMGTAIVLITHDLGAVADIADTVAVLYAGRCVEQGETHAIMRAAEHPYTRGLMGCTPHLRLGAAAAASQSALREIPGLVPPLGRRPAICAFADRCHRADATCLDRPQLPCPHWAPRGGRLLAPGDPRGMNAHSPLPPAADLLRIEDLTVHFPVPGGADRWSTRWTASASPFAGRELRHRRRVGFG